MILNPSENKKVPTNVGTFSALIQIQFNEVF